MIKQETDHVISEAPPITSEFLQVLAGGSIGWPGNTQIREPGTVKHVVG